MNLKKIFALSMSFIAMNLANLSVSAMETKASDDSDTMKISVCNPGALSCITFDVKKHTEEDVCYLCQHPIKTKDPRFIYECGDKLFMSDNPGETYETLKSHMVHQKCANEYNRLSYYKNEFFCGVCKDKKTLKKMSYNYIYPYPNHHKTYSIKMKPANGDSSSEINFEISNNQLYSIQCNKCNKFIGKSEPKFYFGCGKDVYDAFVKAKKSSNPGDFRRETFEAKKILNKYLYHAVCSECAKKINSCPVKDCPKQSTNWLGSTLITNP